MSETPKPPFYELEFSSGVTFWTAGDSSTRRTYLMPVSTPSEFVAFGALGPDNTTVVFVARGRLREDLGSFIARMVQDGSSVELYVWPPLPGDLVIEYTKGPPHEGKEYDDPPNQPIPGMVPVPGEVAEYEPTGGELWTAGDAFSRRALLTPLSNTSEFMALGVLGTEDTVYFALKGPVREELGAFIAQMTQEGAKVELYAEPPLPDTVLSRYLTEPPPGN